MLGSAQLDTACSGWSQHPAQDQRRWRAVIAPAVQTQPTAQSSEPSTSGGDGAGSPFALVRPELEVVIERMRRSVVTDVPQLGSAAEYFFKLGAEGKKFRSTILLLLSSRLAPGPLETQFLLVDESAPSIHPTTPRRRQQRLAEITELIHIASLLHDDVIDEAGTRRGVSAVNTVFGNKVAILAGDFLLARASVSLASLRDTRVIEAMSACLEHLVAGEVLQLTATSEEAASMEHYLRKTFYKTASLMANSCRSAALLGGVSDDDAESAYQYGRNLGLAFQLVDDVLDFTGTADELGKPALSDLKSGLSTAPVLYAARGSPKLRTLAARRFSEPGDVELARDIVAGSDGVAQARQLAEEHADAAAAALQRLPEPSCDEARRAHEALLELTRKVLTRRK